MAGKLYSIIIICIVIFLNVKNVHSEEWLTAPELNSQLPAALTPTESAYTSDRQQCFSRCYTSKLLPDGKSKCDSYAYSEVTKSCVIYSHPSTQNTPVPGDGNMALDYDTHRIYYQKQFCPSGWYADKDTSNCYFINTAAPVDRNGAWTICEQRLMSNLVTFQTKQQRDNLYQILTNNYLTISPQTFWTGYYRFNKYFWARFIEEMPGFLKTYGGVSEVDYVGSLIKDSGYYPMIAESPQLCQLACTKTLRDRCTAFYWEPPNGKCWFSQIRSVVPLANKLGPNNYWMYTRITGRPLEVLVGPTQLSSFNMQNGPHLRGATIWQCRQLCRKTPGCLGAQISNVSSTNSCWLKSMFYTPMAASNDQSSYLTNDVVPNSPCPFGIYYRGLCLVANLVSQRTPITSRDYCRQLGGRLLVPNDGLRKANALFSVIANTNHVCCASVWVDGAFDGTNYVAQDGTPLNDTFQWVGPFQSNSTLFPLFSSTVTDDPNGGYASQFNQRNASATHGHVCELPAMSSSWPLDCRFTPAGREYFGRNAVTATGNVCAQWSTTPYAGLPERFPDYSTSHNFCRNPDPYVVSQPWCYDSTTNVPALCATIPMCDVSDWAANQNMDDLYNAYAVLQIGYTADDYNWHPYSKWWTAYPICQLPMDSWCEMPWRGSCYKHFTFAANYSEAKSYCALNGWHLLEVNSFDEQLFLQTQFLTPGRSTISQYEVSWLALSNYNAAGFYWESDPTTIPVAYANWNVSSSLPANTRAAWLGFSGLWNAFPPTAKKWFICEVNMMGIK